MQKLGFLTAAVALAAVMGMSGSAWGHSGGNHCNPEHASFKGLGHPGCSSVLGGGIDVEKTLEDGPYEFDIEGPLNLGARADLVVHIDPNDHGGIVAKWDVPQHFTFKINITNLDDTNPVDNLLVYDVIPAEFDLDPQGEDAVSGAGDADAEDVADGNDDNTCDDGTCDGIYVDGLCEDANCDGVILSSSADCAMTPGNPDGAFSGPKDPANEPLAQRHKEPEFIPVVIDDLAADGTCMITLFVMTDGNPGHVFKDGNGDEQCLNGAGATVDCVVPNPTWILLFTQYEPGKCEQIASVNHDDDDGTTPEIPVFNTVSLNDGVKIFSLDEDDGDGFQDGFREIGPAGSLQLTANGHDGSFINHEDNIGELFCVPAP